MVVFKEKETLILGIKDDEHVLVTSQHILYKHLKTKFTFDVYISFQVLTLG